VPEISPFSGIVIAMYYSDHAPPHFHGISNDEFALVAIKFPSALIRGVAPLNFALLRCLHGVLEIFS